ncbi:hypothetical protein [Pseudalkalibacillus sp. JSM 102089]|uniref:hypothetical protein n=1 Tax=Pseudalkalibacillus sp. JSM 102089 TaxID=3229856 RepID=UPI00352695DA
MKINSHKWLTPLLSHGKMFLVTSKNKQHLTYKLHTKMFLKKTLTYMNVAGKIEVVTREKNTEISRIKSIFEN